MEKVWSPQACEKIFITDEVFIYFFVRLKVQVKNFEPLVMFSLYWGGKNSRWCSEKYSKEQRKNVNT